MNQRLQIELEEYAAIHIFVYKLITTEPDLSGIDTRQANFDLQ